MSEDNSQTPPGDGENSKPDPLKNLHSEFSRKTENLEKANKDLQAKMDQMLAALKPKPAPAQEPEDIESLAYRDPKKYAEVVEERAARKAAQIIDSRIEQQNRSNSIISQLAAEYPELADTSSEFSKKAVEIYNGLSDYEKASPMAYKLAVRDAAAELDVKPKSKRRASSDDSFTLSGSSGGSGSGGSSRGASEKVDQRTIEVARLFGLNVDDKKVVERLKKRSERKNWNKYEG